MSISSPSRCGKDVLALRAKINVETRPPETVINLIVHYLKNELATERKAFATAEAHRIYIERYVQPKWGVCQLSEVRTVAVGDGLIPCPLPELQGQKSAT